MKIKEKEISKATRDIDLGGFEMQEVLNPKIWDENQKMDPEVRKTLLKIADDYFESLELPNIDIEDITMTGSLSNYNWSKYSDIDLHILVDYDELPMERDLVKDFFKSKTNFWNDEHDIKIYGYDIEIYIQDMDEPHHSTGIYSVLRNEWNVKPSKKKVTIDNSSVIEKSERIMDKIESIYNEMDDVDYDVTIERSKKLTDKIKKMRQSGLDEFGEFSVENIVFKVLRRNGMLDKLYDIKTVAYDKSVTLESEKIKKLSESNDFDWVDDIEPTPMDSSPFKDLKNYFRGESFRYEDFTYYMDDMSGAITWVQDTQDDYIFYATPFWNNEPELPIEYQSDMGEYDTLETIELPEFEYLEEFHGWLDFKYPEIVYNEIIKGMGGSLPPINENVGGDNKTHNLKDYTKKLSKNFTRFLSGLKNEGDEVKNAYKTILSSIKEKRELTPEEKKEIGNKFRDLLKLIGFTVASVLPGGLIYFLIARVSFMKKHMIPKSFLEDKTKVNESGDFDWAINIEPLHNNNFYIDISELDKEGKFDLQKKIIDFGFKWEFQDGYIEKFSGLSDNGYLLYNEPKGRFLYRTNSTYHDYVREYDSKVLYYTANEFLNILNNRLNESNDFDWVDDIPESLMGDDYDIINFFKPGKCYHMELLYGDNRNQSSCFTFIAYDDKYTALNGEKGALIFLDNIRHTFTLGFFKKKMDELDLDLYDLE